MPESFESQAVVAGKLKGTRFLSSSIKEYWVLELMQPVEKFLQRTTLTPNHISFAGFSLTVIASICLATNHLIWGGWLVIWAGCCDFLDGRLARLKNLSSESGAFLDSVLDRYMDFAVLIGLAILFQDSFWLYVVYFALLGSVTTPYIKSKAESLGIECSGGEMQRPERVVLLGVGAMLSGYLNCISYPFLNLGQEWQPVLLQVALVVVAIASNQAAFGRFRHTYELLKSRSKSNA